MVSERAEPFHVALSALRQRLSEGVFAPGERIAASELAQTLRLSATPVREALSQLAGEGLLEDRRGQGWFVRALTGIDIADLYRMSLTVQTAAHDPHRTPLRPTEAGRRGLRAVSDPIDAVQILFAAWVSQAGGHTLLALHLNLQARLEPVRRAEPLVLTDLQDEASRLQALAGATSRADRLAEIRRFYTRRIAVADRLSSVIYSARRPPSV